MRLVVSLLATILLGACGGAAPEPAEVAEPVVVVLPFEVEGQGEGAEFVGRTFAEFLAINLSQTGDLRLLAVPETAGRVDGATHRVPGTLIRDGHAVEARSLLREGPRKSPSWETRLRSEGGDLPELSACLARQMLQGLGIASPRGCDYNTHLTVVREAPESELAASARDS